MSGMAATRRRALLGVLLAAALALSGCATARVIAVRSEAERLYKEGRTAEIIPLVEHALADLGPDLGPDHPYVGEAHNALGILYAYVLNDFERSAQAFERALAIRTKTLGPDHSDTLETLNLMGLLHQALGDLPRAEATISRVLDQRTRRLGPTHPDTADSQIVLAGIFLLRGRYAEGERLLLAAETNEEHRVSARYPSPADSQSLLGTLYGVLGDLDRAERYHRAALAIRQRELGPSHTIVSQSLDALGGLYQRRGAHAEAERHYRQALAIREKEFGRAHAFYADSLMTLALLYLESKDHARAAAHYQEGITVYLQLLGPDNPRTLLARMALALVELGRGRPEAARALCEEVLASPGVQPITELLWMAQVLYSRALQQLGQTNAAIFWGKESVNVIQGLRSAIVGMAQPLQQGFLLQRGVAFRHLAELLIDAGRLAEAQQVMTMLKEDERFEFIRRDAARDSRTTTAAPTPAETPWGERYRMISGKLAAVGRELDRLRRQKAIGLSAAEEARYAALTADARVSQRAFLAFLGELERELAAVSPARAREIGARNLDKLKAMQGVLRELGSGAVLVHYLITEARLHIILTTPQVQLVRQVAIPAPALHRSIGALREVLQDRHRDPRPEARALYDVLIAPIAEDLRQAEARTLMLSMDGALRYVPAGALHDGTRWLAEQYELTLLTEAAQAKLLTRPRPAWSLAGLGVAREIPGYARLPAVRRELEAIVRRGPDDTRGVLPGVIHLDEAFDARTLLDVLDARYPVLHIASHFVFRPGTQEDSFLLLGTGQTLSLARMLADDYDFNGVDLLTLSACETALGDVGADGREVEGFGWLAQRQGAKAVLATLWAVADESTSRFMQRFYRLREERGLSKAAALAEAQREFIASPALAHPFFWAPFILMGNWL